MFYAFNSWRATLSTNILVVNIDVDIIVDVVGGVSVGTESSLSHYTDLVSSVSLLSGTVVVGESTSCKLGLELSKVSGLDWVNGVKDIPVNWLGTWRSGKRSLVDISILHVNHAHEVSESNQVGSRVFSSPVKGLEEGVNENCFSGRQFDSVFCIGWEHDTDSCMLEWTTSIEWICIENSLEFEIVSLSIDSVLTLSFELEMFTGPLLSMRLKNSLTNLWSEKVGTLNINNSSPIFPSYWLSRLVFEWRCWLIQLVNIMLLVPSSSEVLFQIDWWTTWVVARCVFSTPISSLFIGIVPICVLWCDEA